jgi:hypothetical protein
LRYWGAHPNYEPDFIRGDLPDMILKAVHKKSALKGISIDEFIHDAILQAIEEEMQTRNELSPKVDTVKKVNHKVYQSGVAP